MQAEQRFQCMKKCTDQPVQIARTDQNNNWCSILAGSQSSLPTIMNVLRQACRAASQSCAASVRSQGSVGTSCQASCAGLSANGQQLRSMASGGHHGHEVTYKGLTLHAPATWHSYVGKGMCGLMWFWIFVRAYHDGDAFLFGHAGHFEHELHHEGHHEEDSH